MKKKEFKEKVGRKRLTTKEFIKRAKRVHGDDYDYSKVKYVAAQQKVTIICPLHGEFEQTPANHIHGQGCPGCKAMKASERFKDTKDDFVKKAKRVHGNKYDYTVVEYHRSTEKVSIMCKEHGIFMQTPNAHLQGRGCPLCNRPGRK